MDLIKVFVVKNFSFCIIAALAVKICLRRDYMMRSYKDKKNADALRSDYVPSILCICQSSHITVLPGPRSAPLCSEDGLR